MYPNLTPTLVVLLVASSAAAAFIALRRPVLRRLALRQVVRRRREAGLVVLGSMLGTAIIVGSLVVGDTLNFSVKQAAYDNLGPIDETVNSRTLAQGAAVSTALAPLRTDPRVDGVLTVHADLAAVAMGTGAGRVAEPRAGVFDLDFARAASFGGPAEQGSGLTGPAPPPGQTVINADLASALGARAGDRLTFFLYGRPVAVRVARIVPTRGLAGVAIDGVTSDAFFAPGTLVAAAATATRGPGRASPRTLTFVSNVGGVEGGNRYSGAVTDRIERLLGPLGRTGTSVETSKRAVLNAAKTTGDTLGSLFLMIGSFAIIAGVLLLVNIFVMLAEARKPELGMLRAIGMKRSRLVRSFIIEGTVYALVASLLGVAAGIGVGRAVAVIAGRIFSAQPGSSLHLVFHVTPVSLVNGFALGFLISLATVALTSLRISRINVIAAIRDLPVEGSRRMRLPLVVASGILGVGLAMAGASSLAANQAIGAYVFPALAVVCLAPVALRFLPRRWVHTAAALAVLAWTLAASAARAELLTNGSNATFIVIGILLTFAAVVLVSQNQEVVTAPLRPLVDRSTQAGLSARIGIAYPLAKRFRTGAILIMFGLVVFTLVFMTVLSALVQATVSRSVASASGGYAIRADFNPATPIADPARTFASGGLAPMVGVVAPLWAARAEVTGLNASLTSPVEAVAVAAEPGMLRAGTFKLSQRLDGFGGDRAVWQRVLADPRYVIVDGMLGQLAAGGPPRTLFRPGKVFTLIDPLTGKAERRTIAGVLDSSYAFYGLGGGFYSPVVMGQGAAGAQFGADLRPAAALVQPAGGVSDGTLATRLQGRFLAQGLVATRIRQAVEDSYAASNGFFQLMQGFVALGLLVGIAGLAVVMVRAVRERRRSIGVLRALGFQSRTVQRAFLTESLLVAFEGVVLGAGLSILTTYLLFKNYELFRTAGGFSIPWAAIGILVAASILAAVVATAWPARQASRIRPAVALRLAE